MYLYPPGTLLGPGRPSATPVYFAGAITMVNTKADARVQARQVDSAILDLAAPRITQVFEFPNIGWAAREVAIHLDSHGPRVPFVYHAGPQQRRPAVRDRVIFEPVLIPGLPPVNVAEALRYLRDPEITGDGLLREAPVSIRREIVLDVPSPDLYPEDPERVLRQGLERPIRQVADIYKHDGDRRVYREYGESFLVRETQRNGSRFVFRATHRSKR